MFFGIYQDIVRDILTSYSLDLGEAGPLLAILGHCYILSIHFNNNSNSFLKAIFTRFYFASTLPPGDFLTRLFNYLRKNKHTSCGIYCIVVDVSCNILMILFVN